MAFTPAFFDAMFEVDDDPWRFRTSWYEHRKRALTLACLPAPRYRRAFEPGCANGELSAALAPRCDHLLCADSSGQALAQAQTRLKGLDHVELRSLHVPESWPDGEFDLIVISEFAYYLSPDQLKRIAERIRSSLQPGGTVLACHWRHPIDGCALNGAQVNHQLGVDLGLFEISRLTETDLQIVVWSDDARCVATHGMASA